MKGGLLLLIEVRVEFWVIYGQNMSVWSVKKSGFESEVMLFC